MAVPLSLKRRLNALESKLDRRGAIKVFIYHPEEDTPYWTPELPDTWQNANPNGHAILLQIRDCGVK
jgi:hypothetical protein